jgi:hypothetical protein
VTADVSPCLRIEQPDDRGIGRTCLLLRRLLELRLDHTARDSIGTLQLTRSSPDTRDRGKQTAPGFVERRHHRFSSAGRGSWNISPAKALLAQTTTGGWVGRDTLDGRQAEHLAFKDKGVNWSIWIPVDGDPLPQKASIEFTENSRLRKIDIAFSNWNTMATPRGSDEPDIRQRIDRLAEAVRAMDL